jgi:hypothetical protein
VREVEFGGDRVPAAAGELLRGALGVVALSRRDHAAPAPRQYHGYR